MAIETAIIDTVFAAVILRGMATKKDVGGRPRIGKDLLVEKVFTRVSADHAAKLEALAGKYRVKVADILRWLVDDAVSGKWKPDFDA